MNGDPTLVERLKGLEERLLEPEVRKSAPALGELLDDDFREFASSGRIFDKAQIIRLLQDAPKAHSSLADFKAILLAPGVALTTFRYSRGAASDRPAAESLRSSVWRQTNGRWQMLFHQGTLVADE